MDEILLIDKPAGWTSFDVVAKVRSELRKRVANDTLPVNSRGQSSKITNQKSKVKVGHAGTLDPFATGLLIVLVGEACKDAGKYLKLDKTYEFTAKLGEVSSTGDPEGVISKTEKVISKKQVVSGSELVKTDLIRDLAREFERSETAPIQNSNFKIPTSKEVQQALEQFKGEITQVPPAHSAMKVGGQRAYKLARAGKSVELPARQVTVNRLQVLEYNYPFLKCVCDVSSGTYIRSLVEDIGKILQTGAYCIELRRTRIGKYQIENATAIDKL